MTDDWDSGEPANADETFAKTEFEFTTQSRREFKPWHRTRKQYVRSEQWGVEISRLLDSRAKNEERTLSYLGLPGSDLLDIRHVLRSCQLSPEGLLFLGFDESASPGSAGGEGLNIALSEVRSDPSVDPSSDVIGDHISLVGKKNSVALERAIRMGPFDVVNLDLCGGFASEVPGVEGSLYSTVRALLDIQRHSRDPWVFLLTTRLGSDSFDDDALKLLRAGLEKNIRESNPFARELETWIGDPAEVEWSATGPSTEGDYAKFYKFVLVGISKWFLSLGFSAHLDFSMPPGLEYTVYPQSPVADMVSVAFRFSPMPLEPDPMGLASGGTPVPSENSLSVHIPEAVAQIRNVDEVLDNDSELAAKVLKDAAELLLSANYDRQAYLEWVQGL